ncbi:ornithine cyclodeaminase family protein [Pseudomonas sp.]|uniref:ornithine cyclodeaminase family protein n=1 Tax=Pseudomonas sp. TaxID=306 RepID=UPI003D6E369E
MKLYSRQHLENSMDYAKAVQMLETGFIAFSQGQVQVPGVQNFNFAQANGDCCVKSAYISGEDCFTVKVSTGFYDNPGKGLDSNNGLMLVLSALTGQPLALLQDEGWLTCLRTALAGQIVASRLAPSEVQCIGILGTGMQARMQLQHLLAVTDCRQVLVWGRRPAELERYRAFAEQLGCQVETTLDAKDVPGKANLIVTTTPSRTALLRSEWIRPGTHITAVGADAPGKQELEPALLARADRLFVDAIEQCSRYGESAHALSAGLIDRGKLLELGQLLSGKVEGRSNDRQITVADLTGVAVQDAQIARCALACCQAV